MESVRGLPEADGTRWSGHRAKGFLRGDFKRGSRRFARRRTGIQNLRVLIIVGLLTRYLVHFIGTLPILIRR